MMHRRYAFVCDPREGLGDLRAFSGPANARFAPQELEAIEKHEMDMLSLGNKFVMKTHKGEQVIENDDDLKLMGKDIVLGLWTSLGLGSGIVV